MADFTEFPEYGYIDVNAFENVELIKGFLKNLNIDQYLSTSNFFFNYDESSDFYIQKDKTYTRHECVTSVQDCLKEKKRYKNAQIYVNKDIYLILLKQITDVTGHNDVIKTLKTKLETKLKTKVETKVETKIAKPRRKAIIHETKQDMIECLLEPLDNILEVNALEVNALDKIKNKDKTIEKAQEAALSKFCCVFNTQKAPYDEDIEELWKLNRLIYVLLSNKPNYNIYCYLSKMKSIEHLFGKKWNELRHIWSKNAEKWSKKAEAMKKAEEKIINCFKILKKYQNNLKLFKQEVITTFQSSGICFAYCNHEGDLKLRTQGIKECIIKNYYDVKKSVISFLFLAVKITLIAALLQTITIIMAIIFIIIAVTLVAKIVFCVMQLCVLCRKDNNDNITQILKDLKEEKKPDHWSEEEWTRCKEAIIHLKNKETIENTAKFFSTGLFAMLIFNEAGEKFIENSIKIATMTTNEWELLYIGFQIIKKIIFEFKLKDSNQTLTSQKILNEYLPTDIDPTIKNEIESVLKQTEKNRNSDKNPFGPLQGTIWNADIYTQDNNVSIIYGNNLAFGDCPIYTNANTTLKIAEDTRYTTGLVFEMFKYVLTIPHILQKKVSDEIINQLTSCGSVLALCLVIVIVIYKNIKKNRTPIYQTTVDDEKKEQDEDDIVLRF